MESWKQFCPDFEIIEWNESNSKSFQNKFYKDAIRKKKYAFASDCIRVQALYEKGGIYLDTDMLLLKPVDILLNNKFFTGLEVADRPAYGFFGSVPGHPFLKHMVAFYKSTEFNQFAPPVITHAFSAVINEQSLGPNDTIFPTPFFYAVPYEKRDEDYSQFITKDAYAVHLWDHSWKPARKETIGSLLEKLGTVMNDYLFHGYSYSFFKRYFREFSRKLWHRMINKKQS
jgi:mannosyltransferase OCH1-like enzyme